jgi:hypothetical protein
MNRVLTYRETIASDSGGALTTEPLAELIMVNSGVITDRSCPKRLHHDRVTLR